VYFAGKKIWDGAGMVEDRLGSKVETSGTSATSYYPYGELKSGTASQFATYLRAGSGLDYAQQRWYSSQVMRFTSPDPYRASGGAAEPQSWNRYGYVENDPVGFNDPSGLYIHRGEGYPDYYWDWIIGPPGFYFSPAPSPERGGTDVGGGSPAVAGATTLIRSSPIKVTNSAKNWNAADQELSRARDRVVGMAFSQPCLDTLGALGVTPAQIVQAAGSAQFNDAMTSSATHASLYANSPLARSVPGDWANQTVGGWFSSDPSVMAAASLKGNQIYFRPAGVDASDLLFDAALLVHELIHDITGYVDGDIATKLGLPQTIPGVVKAGSDWITSRFYDDCF